MNWPVSPFNTCRQNVFLALASVGMIGGPMLFETRHRETQSKIPEGEAHNKSEERVVLKFLSDENGEWEVAPQSGWTTTVQGAGALLAIGSIIGSIRYCKIFGGKPGDPSGPSGIPEVPGTPNTDPVPQPAPPEVIPRFQVAPGRFDLDVRLHPTYQPQPFPSLGLSSRQVNEAARNVVTVIFAGVLATLAAGAGLVGAGS